MDLTLTHLVVIGLSAVTAAMMFVLLKAPASVRPPSMPAPEPCADLVFLFDKEALVDCTAPGLIRSDASGPKSDWDLLLQSFTQRFAGLPGRPSDVDEDEPLECRSTCEEDPARVLIRREGARTIVRLHQPVPQDIGQILYEQNSLKRQVEQLTYMLENAPAPIWHLNTREEIDFANAAYRGLSGAPSDAVDDEGRLRQVFEPASVLSDGPQRQAIAEPDGARRWYDIHSVRLPTGTHNFAVDIDAVVNSEAAQRNFVQTLAKTFAQLSTGLAIFDRNRQLVLFNPALIDLTKLPVDFLSSRPALLSFFDHMRESKVMPEPKNYASWRENIGALVSEAGDGKYSELWSLPSGLTYRVTGRPHPDGALAFLFEDITAEITLTRGFRAELELSKSLLDNLGEAVAVFSNSGVLSLSNKAYRDLWNMDHQTAFSEITVFDSSQTWNEERGPSPHWQDICDFVLNNRDRTEWAAIIGKLRLRVVPLSGGATMVSFRYQDVAAVPNAKATAASH
ncbi:PAS domain-containing protein [Poseidonocella pacifica]|uniref:PAS domain-containing protein n=1 Tax=Poseidonocella pacifica TaxID=871651 RepID=A0A1I0XUD2_9RHOB|nr:PAS-domain containing protein [Poseidonocella pacifica]SFB04524.1 PAS domain-containing protein [Poseidonocella pacifica]